MILFIFCTIFFGRRFDGSDGENMRRDWQIRGEVASESRHLEWYELARAYGIPLAHARLLYDEATALAAAWDHSENAIMRIYASLLGRVRSRARAPSPGKITRTMTVVGDAMRSPSPRGNSQTAASDGEPVSLMSPWSETDDSQSRGVDRVEDDASQNIIDKDAARARRTRALLVDLSAAMGFIAEDVPVHVNEVARRKTEARGARGLMEDDEVYLNPGKYNPDSVDGQQLLAHEVVHVAQRRLSREPNASASVHRGMAEKEAGAMASSFVAGHSIARPVVPLQARMAADNDGDQELEGTKVRKFGIAYKKEGVNLRDKAAPAPVSKVKKLLPFNTHMFVDSEENEYYFVTTGAGDFGYVAKTHVNINLPEPSAKIYYVQSGDTALEISRKHYGGEAKWGSDHRFFVNGLVFVNAGSGKRGIYKPNDSDDWEQTQVRENYMIWVPGLPFMRSLQGTVKSGSISHEAWQTVKSTAQAVGDFLLGAGAFIAGLLHGVLESVWDILVGLKDLAVMAWDILKSLFTLELLSDAKGLWNDLANLDWDALVQGWLDKFDAKWNHKDLLTKWHFRGWVIGYVVAEVVMLVFSGGVIQGIKWAGKAAKVAKVVSKFPRIARFAKTAKESKAASKLIQGLSKGGGGVAKSARTAKAFVSNLLKKPKSIWGKGPDEIAEAFRKAGYQATIEQSNKGSKLSKQIRIKGNKEISNIQIHPGGGRHGGSYYKISSSTKGKIKIVNKKTYKPTPGEKATIIYMDTGPSGWLLRAVIANGAAQKARREGE